MTTVAMGKNMAWCHSKRHGELVMEGAELFGDNFNENGRAQHNSPLCLNVDLSCLKEMLMRTIMCNWVCHDCPSPLQLNVESKTTTPVAQ